MVPVKEIAPATVRPDNVPTSVMFVCCSVFNVPNISVADTVVADTVVADTVVADTIPVAYTLTKLISPET